MFWDSFSVPSPHSLRHPLVKVKESGSVKNGNGEKRQYKAGDLKKEKEKMEVKERHGRENLQQRCGLLVLFPRNLGFLAKKKKRSNKSNRKKIYKTSERGGKLTVTLGTKDTCSRQFFTWTASEARTGCNHLRNWAFKKHFLWTEMLHLMLCIHYLRSVHVFVILYIYYLRVLLFRYPEKYCLHYTK